MSASQHTINSFQFRAEMCVHTKFGLMNSCTEVYSLFEHAKERGITAIAITDCSFVNDVRPQEGEKDAGELMKRGAKPRTESALLRRGDEEGLPFFDRR